MPTPTNESLSSVLLAAAATTLAQRPLKHVKGELNVVEDNVPRTLITELLNATLSSMLHAFPTASVVHIACHGKQDTMSALDSDFLLADGILTVAQPMALHRIGCFERVRDSERRRGTAGPGGAPRSGHALRWVSKCGATMWYVMLNAHPSWCMGVNAFERPLFAGKMGDQDGLFVAKVLYGTLFKDGKLDLNVVPYALDDTVRQLHAWGLSPSRWATFIHLGA